MDKLTRSVVSLHTIFPPIALVLDLSAKYENEWIIMDWVSMFNASDVDHDDVCNATVLAECIDHLAIVFSPNCLEDDRKREYIETYIIKEITTNQTSNHCCPSIYMAQGYAEFCTRML